MQLNMHIYRLFLVLIGEPAAHRRYTYREVAAEEEEEGTTRDVEGTGVGVEVPALMVELQELTLEGHWAFALASKVSDSSYLHLLFDGTLPVGADLDCRHPMMVLAWTTRCGVWRAIAISSHPCEKFSPLQLSRRRKYTYVESV